MLNDDGTRALELAGELESRIQIDQVIEGQLLALQLDCVGEHRCKIGVLTIEGGTLMRILSVTQIAHLVQRQEQFLRKALVQLELSSFVLALEQVRSNRRIVTGC